MTGTWPFQLDRFQREAIAALDAGSSVLVSAPTSSGKTVVAEHAIDLALAEGRRAFYTAPIKALSNQKFRDLRRRLGDDTVGILTGDNAIAADAPVVVMTTEVLRNMLYAGSEALDGLGCVVLDEVHFLEDPYRGAVWEEVVLNLAPDVRMVALSATVSNSAELGAWLRGVRGTTEVVVEDCRPVPLRSHYLVVERRRGRRLHRLPVLVDGSPNRSGSRFDLRGHPRHRRRGQGWATPRRREVLELLRREDLLPAIHFVFSRAGCDDARDAVLREGARLNGADEAERVSAHVERRLEHLPEADRGALGVDAWEAGLRRGVAAHHAGQLPLFKEVTEELFAAGLLKLVYATETLALGVNLPARSVVIEKLTKFTGEAHELLTPGQFTQLTGRAGRRGLDSEGNALICWSPFVGFAKVAELARSRDFLLRSAFRPTYNMVANLMATRSREEAADLLSRSFGQFQSQGRAGSGRRRSGGADLLTRMGLMEQVLSIRGLADGWCLTREGRALCGIYNEADLLVVEAISAGHLGGLAPPELAGVVSCLTYRRRGPGGGQDPGVPASLAGRTAAVASLADEIGEVEEALGLPRGPLPDPGMAGTVLEWAQGGSLGDALGEEFGGGEFVRNVQLVSDRLGQIAKVADGDLATSARLAVDGIERGVVALAGALTGADGVVEGVGSGTSPPMGTAG